MKKGFFSDFTSNPFKLIGAILLIIAIVGGISLFINYYEHSNSYTTACSKQDFESAHRILHEMKADINHKATEMKKGELPPIYQEYIDALLYVYGEEMKYLLDQDNPQAEKRLQVLGTELTGEANSLMTTFEGLAREFSFDFDQQPFYNLRDNLMAGLKQLSDYYNSVKKAQSE